MLIEASSTQVNSSPIQLENPMKAFKKIYLILIPLGTIAFTVMGGIVGALIGLVIGWAVSYISMQFISGIKLFNLNFKDYALDYPFTDDQLFMNLSSLECHPDFKIEKGAWGIRFTFKNTTEHRIHIDKEKLTYSITSKLKKGKIIKKRHNPGVTEYVHAYTAVPYINQMIEAAVTL